MATAKRPYPFSNRDQVVKKPNSSNRNQSIICNFQVISQAVSQVQNGGKSPVSALNELGLKVNYAVLDQKGPPHCPNFTVEVKVENLSFKGCGHSKREARAAAAGGCLRELLAKAGQVMSPLQGDAFTHDDFASPVTAAPAPPTPVMAPPTPATSALSAVDSTSVSAINQASNKQNGAPAASSSISMFGAPQAQQSNKSAINILYENYPSITFKCTHWDGTPLEKLPSSVHLSNNMRFKVVYTVDNQSFDGYGSSKKLAKLAAARTALAALAAGSPGAAALPMPRENGAFTPLHDTVARLVNDKFNELMRDDHVHSKRKVLAGVVISDVEDVNDIRVLAVTSGTKCVSGSHLSVSGRVVNDCHAEILARRCVQHWLYSQLWRYATAPAVDVALPDTDIEPLQGGGYRLRPTRRLHLYISTAPCGDARIFSPHEPTPDKHPNRLARGQLRTKIESGEGTIPVNKSDCNVQTWDGVMQGSRLLTMSCSDKLARWCVTGIQGSLLSQLVLPMYLDSIVMGSLLHPHHAQRALFGRFEQHLDSLPPPFRLQRPTLACAASLEPRTPQRAPNFAVAWTCTDKEPEIVNATTGKLETGQPSVLCKQSMFARWLQLVCRLPRLPQVETGAPPPPLPQDLGNILYSEAKQFSPAYEVAKWSLYAVFDRCGLGRWVRKPLEQDQFSCELLHAGPDTLFA